MDLTRLREARERTDRYLWAFLGLAFVSALIGASWLILAGKWKAILWMLAFMFAAYLTWAVAGMLAYEFWPFGSAFGERRKTGCYVYGLLFGGLIGFWNYFVFNFYCTGVETSLLWPLALWAFARSVFTAMMMAVGLPPHVELSVISLTLLEALVTGGMCLFKFDISNVRVFLVTATPMVGILIANAFRASLALEA